MTLKNWLANHWLAEHETTTQEIGDLLGVVERDLADSAVGKLSADNRMTIAYNAALQLATLALAAEGYRPARDRAHERAIQSLRFTIGTDAELIDTIDAVRRKRNASSYDRAGVASLKEASEMHRIATELHRTVLAWLRREHAELLRR